ncbi:Metalloendoproteinase 1 [Morella rubra]|uniref:Metalloendoproteinase 1 n=1 Tax=Morella rubra TaxID=262757 RepID=A0A6A1W256_9ROSI|nr:Metalloendoproteinase 1 [Morella rubra]
MNSRVFSLFSSTLLLLLLVALLPLLSCATSPESDDKRKSAFEFLKHLQGCHHGDKVKGIHDLKNFQTWAANTHFKFSQAQTLANADLKIGFLRRNHGDGSLFDGTGGILAHAFVPTDGRFHYDANEQWSVGAKTKGI